MLGLIGLILLIMTLCIYFAVYIGPRASVTWLLAIFISVFEDAFLVQPVKIWVKHIIITAPAVKDVNIVLNGLRDRVKYVLLRKTNLMKSMHHDIQHLNPACRTARYFPDLPVSRLLF